MRLLRLLRPSRFPSKWFLVLVPIAFLAVPLNLKADLFVASGGSTNSVLRFNNAGTLVGTFVASGSGGLIQPGGLVFGPDRNLYVVDVAGNAVRRYNGSTGAFIDSFVPAGAGGLRVPVALVFGPDGNLYVAEAGAALIRRYNGTTGAYMGVFTSGGGNPAVTQEWLTVHYPSGLAFGPDGNLFVADEFTVVKFNGSTGAFISIFVPNAGGGHPAPGTITFGSDGNLYAGTSHDGVLCYNGTTAALISQFVPYSGARMDVGVAFGPDGNLYVGDFHNGSPTDFVARYNGQTGAPIDIFVPSGVIGIINGLTFSPAGPQGTQVLPNQGGNAGTVTVQILGSSVQAGAQVKLTGLGPDIAGTLIATSGTTVATARFNLQGAALGVRNVVVTNPDNTSVTLPGAFTIMQGGAPQLSANIVGFNAIWIGRAQGFLVSYGNSGNVDALGVHLIVTFPTSVASSLGFGNEVGVVSTGTVGANTVVTVDLGRVPAGSKSLITMLLTANSSQQPFSIQTSIRGH